MSHVMLRLPEKPRHLLQDNLSSGSAEQHPSVMPSPSIPSLVQSLEGGKPDVQIAARFGVRICRVRALRRYYGFQR